MKKGIIIIGLSLFISLCCCIYYVKYSDTAERTYKNVENSKKIRVGMSIIDLKVIMGNPDKIYPHYSDESIKVYFYQPPFAASDGIEFHIDKNNLVTFIVHYEPT